MIRKFIVALLLIGAGLGVLHLTIGFENFTRPELGPNDEPIRRTRDERGLGGGIKVGGGDASVPSISVSGSGEFRDVRREERLLPDGSRQRLRVYELFAEDSETVAEDLVRLDRINAQFFRIEDEPGPPREVHVGTITARQAFLQVAEDAAGKPSVREDRDMDLRDVVLETTDDARVRGLRLDVERLLLRQTEQGIEFHTPTVDVPFSLTLAGDDAPTSLRGNGVRGILPPRSDAPGSVLEIHVDSQPELVRGRSSIRSSGPLEYVEDLATGVGDVELIDDVEVDGLLGAAGQQATTAHGSRLTGRLLRFRRVGDGGASRGVEGDRQNAAWRTLKLEGGPDRRADLVSAGLRLTCDRLTVHPAFDGQPAMFIADGEPELTDPSLPPGEAPEFRATERIYVIDVPLLTGAPLRRLGYPQPSFGRLVGRLVIFEGRSSIVDPEHGLEIEASDGIRLLQGADGDLSMVVGKGAVQVRSRDLNIRGPMGFVLHQDGERRTVRLGPENPDSAHEFEVERSTADGPLIVSGSGRCTFRREADGSTHFEVDSPADDLSLTRGSGRLLRVGFLDAGVSPTGTLERFVARGTRPRVETTLAGRNGGPEESVVGEAGEIRSEDGSGILLVGAASVDRSGGGHAEGDTVEIQRLGKDDAILVSRGTPARVRIPVVGSGPAREIELKGARLRMMPGFVPRALLAWHGIDHRLSTALTARLAIAEGAVEARALDPDGKVLTTARGDHLVLRPEDGLATLRGLPARLDSLTEDGRRLVANAPLIRVVGGDLAARRATLLPADGIGPELEVFGRDGERAFRAFRISCDVPIRADEVGVEIDGPFEVRGLDENGAVERDGIALDARSLVLTWQPGTRAVERLVAHGDAVLSYRRLTAFGDEMRVDAIRTLLEIESLSDRPAGVELRGRRLEGDMFRADYEAQELRAWGLRGGGAR